MSIRIWLVAGVIVAITLAGTGLLRARTAPALHGHRPFRILYAGDSITIGVAATSRKAQYTALLTTYIQKALPNRTVKAESISPADAIFDQEFPHCTVSVYMAPMVRFLTTHPPTTYNLIILQHGEHERKGLGKTKMEALNRAWMKLFAGSQRPILICVGNWTPWFSAHGKKKYSGWPKNVEDSMRRYCQQAGGIFVPVEAIASDPRNSGDGNARWGHSAGIKWHPNDRAHELYAGTIFRAFAKAAQKRGLKLHHVLLPPIKP